MMPTWHEYNQFQPIREEVRIPSGGSTKFVVVWVEVKHLGTPQEFKRAYLVRDTA